MNVDKTNAEFVQKVSKTFMKGGDEIGEMSPRGVYQSKR